MNCLTPEYLRALSEQWKQMMPCGIRIVETTYITKEVQRRRHRKKRINKKWRKRYGMKHVEDPNTALLFQDPVGVQTLFVHPKMAAKLRGKIQEEIINNQLSGFSEQFK